MFPPSVKTKVLVILLLGSALSARAVSVTGADWIVHYNLPDQNSGSAYPGEFAIRDALLARINALQSGDEGTLATYTFSGNSASAGAAGPILDAISNALSRGASVRFVAAKGITLTSNYWPGVSLSGLAARPVNPLVLTQDDTSASTIMHDKLGVFRYGSTSRWVFVTSWNFTGGASTYQWNIGVEMRNDDVFGAYTNEMRELLEGHFHDHTNKLHAQDGTRFRLADSWTNGWVRFAPYPDGTDGGTNAQTDITNLIAGAREEIVFGLNKLTRPLIAGALVAAADRGVSVHGVIPGSDTEVGGDSYDMYVYLTNTASYATTNIVHLLVPFERANNTNLDDGTISDLVHEKWMVIDPWGERPAVIHGSANWTDTALVSANGNDENVIFLFHRDVARLFYAQFKRMTGTWSDRDDFWCDLARSNGGWRVDLWVTDTNRFALESASALDGAWTAGVAVATGQVGRTSFQTNAAASSEFFRAQRR